VAATAFTGVAGVGICKLATDTPLNLGAVISNSLIFLFASTTIALLAVNVPAITFSKAS